jgi:hypothetical protein
MPDGNEHRELRQVLAELRVAARRIEAALRSGERLPEFPLHRCAIDVQKAARRLTEHAARLAGEAR